MTSSTSAPAERPAFHDMTRVFARVGLLSFGGPAAQIALMHRMLVEERGWLSERRFLHALNYCMLLPGPEAMQLATYVGWLLHGIRGGLIAGLLFVLPGAIVITGLSILYLLLGEAPAVSGLLFGLKAAVLAIVAEALLRVSRRALNGSAMYAIAAVAFIGIALLKIPFPIIVLAAALAGAMVRAGGGATQSEVEPVSSDATPVWTRPSPRRLLATTTAWLAPWLLPLVALAAWFGGEHVLAEEARFFSVMAAVTFGGAYAVLAYVAQQAVEVYGWLRPDEMLTGLGLAETTPGPLILVLVFVGFHGAARQVGIDPLLGGLAGAAVALWFTFVPCFLWIFAGAPYIERLRNVRWLAAALSGVTAAVVGVIANLALWFGLHVLFRQTSEMPFGPFVLPAPELGSFDWQAAAIALGAGVALLWFHANLFAVLALAMLAGIALALF